MSEVRLVAMSEEQAKRLADAAETIARTRADMKRCRDTPDDEWGGHKGIYLANLEGFLGVVAGSIGDDLRSMFPSQKEGDERNRT